SAPDHVVLETTGIAEPAAILDGLVKVPEAQREQIVPAGVVCVVDAETGASAVTKREEAREQAAAADRVLLAKLDVATVDAVRATHAVLDEVARDAERAAFPSDDAGALAMTAWVVEPRKLRAWTTRKHDHDEHAGHHHGGQLVAVTFADDAPLVGERVLAVIEALGDRLVRAKGFVHLAGEPRRGFVERAGVRTSLELRDAWDGAARRSEIVLIGDDLDEAALRRALWACRAAG
ncbi:MAG TPA: GTP-binding protein, partial [Kofleriaceae bacterium]